MEATFTTTGALIGLALAILLIIKKVHPAYSLILGALVGGLIGGGDLVTIVNTMVLGAQGMMSSILRILTSGILAGALIKTGSAEKIAESIIKKLGQQRAITALAIATMIICAVGVFIDIAVITVAPIALAIGKKANLSKSSILLAMIGGGKAGNIISPNPNTIAASEAFKVDLTSLMVQNIIPAIAALVVTIILAKIVSKKNNDISYDSEEQVGSDLPAFLPAISGPLVVICLLALRPLFGITIDPLIALPLGGLISILATGYLKETVPFVEYGLSKVVGVSILLIGTGTLSGIIKASNLQFDMIHLLEFLNMPTFILAPLSGIFMGAATASTTSGTTIASQTFAETLIKSG
ncbi:GntP family permease, partial [Streptococcus agalactiae]|nr:GntP family permease [Streptococcus agalactiae]